MTALRKLFNTTTFRLAFIFMLLFGSASMMAIGYIYWNTRTILARQLDQTIEAELQGIAEHYLNGGISRVITAIRLRSRKPGNSIYLISKNNGEYLAGNIKSVSRSLWNSVGKVEFDYQRVNPDGKGKVEKRLAFAAVFRLPEDYRVIVGKDIEDRRVFEQVIRSALFWVIGGMLLVGLGGGWLISRNLLARLDALTASSKMIMNGDLSERLPVNGSGDEFDRLSASVNMMLDRIEDLLKGMKEVSDNIAHDLKTPLTRLRNRIEAVLITRDKTRYRETLEATIEDADGLIATFKSLLSIARMEAGTSTNKFTPIAIADILEEVGELYEPVLEEVGGSLQIKADTSLQVTGDRQMLGQMIANLIDNSIKYAASSASDTSDNTTKENAPPLLITLELKKSGAHVQLVIADNGPGIPASEREHVLKRFVRLEKSRSRPGSGLGLSLVAAIAHLHGAYLTLEDTHPGAKFPGLKVSINFPVTKVIDAAA